jgi:type II secretory pathway pseudopilin PulG
MKRHLIIATLLWLPWLAAAENGVTTLSQQQQFLNQRDQQAQQQRMLNNQQMEQRQQQGYPLKANQPKMLPYNGNNNPMQPQMTTGKMLQNGNQAVNPFNQTAPAIPQVPLPATPLPP